VGKLFAAPLGREMAAAAELRREFRFTLLADARGSFPEAAADDRILLQGVVDCFFVTEDGVTIVDYKTDRVTEDEVPARAERYRVQLRTYADALRRILGLPVRRCVLWFLRPGAAFELPAEDV
jgi:ATP-dependent helicase/nuclease subunit A